MPKVGVLDGMVQSRFVEMFGTLDNPTQNFQTARLEELCSKITRWKTWWMCTRKRNKEVFCRSKRNI